MTLVLLTSVTNLGPPLRGIGTIGLEGQDLGSPSIAVLEIVISGAIGIISAVAAIWFIFLLITGGLAWMSAGGDKVKVEDAQKRLTSGLIGLIIVIAGIYLADLIGYLLGLDLLDPGAAIIKIMATI